MVHKIRIAWAYIWIVHITVYNKRIRFDPLTILIVQTLLRYLTYINLGIEVCGKRFVMIACVTIYNIKIVYFVKVVFCGISGEHLRYSWVEAATENSR